MDYAQLQTSVAQWLHRTDLDPIIPDFIRLVEEKLNRSLRTKDNEIAIPSTEIVDYKITLPAGAVAVKNLWGNFHKPVNSQALEVVIARQGQGQAGLYAWSANELVFDGVGTVQGVAYRSIPALSDLNTSNWVLDRHSGVYLFGTLAEANLYIKNAEEASVWKARFDGLIDELNGISQRDKHAGPLTVRVR